MWYQLEKSVQKSENIKNNWCIDPTTARINAGITKLCGQRAKKLASSDACLSSSAQNLRYWWDDTGWYIWISRPQKKVYYFMRKLTFFLENRQQWQQFLKYTLKRGNYGVPGRLKCLNCKNIIKKTTTHPAITQQEASPDMMEPFSTTLEQRVKSWEPKNTEFCSRIFNYSYIWTTLCMFPVVGKPTGFTENLGVQIWPLWDPPFFAQFFTYFLYKSNAFERNLNVIWTLSERFSFFHIHFMDIHVQVRFLKRNVKMVIFLWFELFNL